MTYNVFGGTLNLAQLNCAFAAVSYDASWYRRNFKTLKFARIPVDLPSVPRPNAISGGIALRRTIPC